MSDDEKKNADELEFHTDMPVGEILRRTRVHYGQSLNQIEGILRIRASQLEALEKGDISQLPGRVYAIGFVRAYSEYLGLDGDKMVHLFKEQSVGRKAKPDLSFPVPASESKIPSIAIVGASAFGVIVLIGFVSLMLFPKADKNNIPEVPVKLTESKLNKAPSLVHENKTESKEAEGEEESKPSNRIVLEITDAAWIEIRDKSGSAILRQVLKKGDVYLVPDEDGLVMATGNAGGITVKVDGKKVGSLGEAGQIRRKINLIPDALKAHPKTN